VIVLCKNYYFKIHIGKELFKIHIGKVRQEKREKDKRLFVEIATRNVKKRRSLSINKKGTKGN